MASKKKSGNGTPAAPKTRTNKPIPDYDFGKNAADAETKFGNNVLFSCFLNGARQQWAEHLRKLEASLKSPLSEAQIEEERGSWKPTVKRRGQAPDVKAAKLLSKLSAEEKAALLESLQS